jgi:hypothetical protein
MTLVARRSENVEGHQDRRSSVTLTKRQRQPSATFERLAATTPQPPNV